MQGVEEGKGSLGLLVKDETLYNDARDTVASLKTISADIEQGKGTLGKLAKDEALYADAQTTMKSIREMTDSMNKGEGTLGKLMKDDTLATEAEKTHEEGSESRRFGTGTGSYHSPGNDLRHPFLMLE